MNVNYLYHVCSQSDWLNSLPDQYQQLGPFTHLSTAKELDQSVRIHLAQETNLILLCIDPQQISTNLRWEEVSSRSTPMPHLYGYLPQRGIYWALCLPDHPDQNGSRCPSFSDLQQKTPPLSPRFSLFKL